MPHVIVKIADERSVAEKTDLTTRITQAVMAALGHDADAVSVAIEDVPWEDWMTSVYEPDIVGKQDVLFKRPGYGPLAS